MRKEQGALPPHVAPQSGAQGLLGYHVDLSDPSGHAILTLTIEGRHLNRNGTLHGGIHSMMLDAAAGFAASRLIAGDGPLAQVQTLTLNTNFIAAAAEGQVVATGRVTGGGYKIIYASADIHDGEGKLLSTASGVFKRITK